MGEFLYQKERKNKKQNTPLSLCICCKLFYYYCRTTYKFMFKKHVFETFYQHLILCRSNLRTGLQLQVLTLGNIKNYSALCSMSLWRFLKSKYMHRVECSVYFLWVCYTQQDYKIICIMLLNLTQKRAFS